MPGNHDVDRKIANSKVTKTLHESIRSKQGPALDRELREILTDENSAKALLAPLAEYNTFAARFQCSISAAMPYWERPLQLPCGTIIRLRGLCSALVSNEQDAKNNIVLGQAQVNVHRVDGVEYLTLCHYPPDWLQDQDTVVSHLESKVRMQLFGHKHVVIDEEAAVGGPGDGFADKGLAATMIGAVLGQPRPVIVVADTAAQFEALFLRLWDELWPAERARFSFCTGALMPRANAGALLDLQAVPRAIPPSQFRKSASAALVLDLRAPGKPEGWVDLVLDGAVRGDATFRSWLEAAAGGDAGRAVVPSLAALFGAWHAPGSSARSALASVVDANDLDPGVRSRLIGMVFDRAFTESGAAGRRELLQELCGHRDNDLAPIATMLEDHTRLLFEESRTEGVALVLSLLGGELTEVGERVLRAAVLLLVPNDLETFGDAQAPFLPTIVGANPALARSPILWQRVGSRSVDVLSQLNGANLDDVARAAVIDAILTSGHDISVDPLVRFGGKVAIIRALTALASGQLQLSWQWRSALSAQPNTVLEWLESLSSPSPGTSNSAAAS